MSSKSAGIHVFIDETTGMNRPDEPVLGGVSLAMGRLTKGGAFALKSAAGQSFSVEGTPAAYWPDGSIKWMQLCGQVDLEGSKRNAFELVPDAADLPALKVETAGQVVKITGGVLDVHVAADPDGILSVAKGGLAMLKDPGLSAQLVFTGPDGQNVRSHSVTFDAPPQVVVTSANRVVVRLGGKFLDAENTCISELLLFVEVLRQSSEIHIEPVWIYLGKPQDDLVASLNLTVHRPIEADKSFYAFGNERGVGHWDVIQPVQLPIGNGPRWPLARQVQLGSSFYRTEKCTFPSGASWVKILEGGKAPGWCFLADEQFGLTAAMRYFWQEYPHSLAVDCNAGTITFGLVPAEAKPLDWRRYSPIMYGPPVYEYSKYSDDHGATGLAKAHELMLRFDAADADLVAPRLPAAPPAKTPTTKAAAARADADRQPQLVRLAAARRKIAQKAMAFVHPTRIMTSGDYFASTAAIGKLGGADAAAHPQLEKQLANIMDYMLAERDFRGWYGLLDFGDVMCSYYADKDMWAYDDGGHAWLNTESLPDYGFWIAALRSQRPDWLEFAIEMSRHNRDVDVYHRGPFTGSGSRHGVNHWSDGDKEWRVSMPLVRRLHYYMTADPWTKETILSTVALYQSMTRVAGTAPSMTSAFAGIFVKWELTNDPACAATLSNFADVYAQAFGPDGMLCKTIYVDLATGIGRLEDTSKHESLFFLNTFGGEHVLVEYAELAGHKSLSDALVRHARWAIKKDGGVHTAIMYFVAHAYRQTGEKVFLDGITKVLDKRMFKLHDLGGPGLLDETPHKAIPYNRAKQMSHYVGDVLHMIPYGLASDLTAR